MNGKSIIVTGAGSGIGRATALILGIQGANLTIADYNESTVAETARMVQARGGKAQTVRADVRREEDIVGVVERAISTYGRLDGAANVAGRSSHSLMTHELMLEQWNDCIAVNLTGAFLCLKHEIPAMLRSGGGSVVIVSSTAAVRAFPATSEYSASKAGILGLVRCAAYEYGKQGIRVNSVLPGVVETPMARNHLDKWPQFEDLVKGQHLVGRFGKPDELGYAITWLLSDESSFVTGANIPVDGGQSAA